MRQNKQYNVRFIFLLKIQVFLEGAAIAPKALPQSRHWLTLVQQKRRCQSSVQSCLFVQCWLWVFLVYCRRNLNNIGVEFAATRHYLKINWSKMKIVEKRPDVVQRTLHWNFSCAMLSGASRTTLHRPFTCAMLSQEYQDNTEQVFPVHCCLEAQGQHYMELLSVQCCLKSITIKLHRIFSCAMLAHGSRITLNGKLIYNVSLIYLGHYCAKKLPVQCQPIVNGQLSIAKQPLQCCVYQSETTFHRNIVFSMLSKYV